ncbi:unnamed protein product [Pleuronectes platessa]|uniref:Uncharacterized protein n=1 Tax=Pleuronectes platessa TaxID=8262 RepID=A0A9N7V8R5_PLEPL|nr:unnamed protein product [Pleuronectes platessa]
MADTSPLPPAIVMDHGRRRKLDHEEVCKSRSTRHVGGRETCRRSEDSEDVRFSRVGPSPEPQNHIAAAEPESDRSDSNGSLMCVTVTQERGGARRGNLSHLVGTLQFSLNLDQV